MTKAQFLESLDELLELPVGTLKGSEELTSFESWDSLASVGFLGLADRHFGISIAPSEVEKTKTVDDLIALVSARLD